MPKNVDVTIVKSSRKQKPAEKTFLSEKDYAEDYY